MTFDFLDIVISYVFGMAVGIGIISWGIGAFGCYTDCHLCPKKDSSKQEN